MKTTLALSGVFLLAGLAAAQSKAGDDLIRRENGQVIRRVEVISETLDQVTYKRRNKEETLPSSEVREIEWGEAGEAYSRATFAAGRGDHEQAANLFQETADRTGRAALKAHASFMAARSLFFAATGDATKAPAAARALDAWLGANAEHRMMPNARELLGRSWLLAGQADQALAAFRQLAQDAGAKNLGGAWVARAKFGEAQALVAKDQFGDARSAYVSASATLGTLDPKEDPAVTDLLVAAKMGEGECYIEEKRYADARRFFSNLASSRRDSPALSVAARCGEAQAIFEEAVAKKDMGQLRQAQSMFAEVSATDIMDGEASAKAVYYLGRTLLALGENGEGPTYNSRAQALFRSVIDLYPSSHWAVEARQASKQ